jgi:glycosyltransferase involved in cell wall biosynthesis
MKQGEIPFFTVVVPTYNRAGLIDLTLTSLRNQSYQNYEIIIVDDGSTDNTEVVVQPFLNDRTSYVKKGNSERAASRNFGAKLAKGDYINFFDSDDIALQNHLVEAAKVIQTYGTPEWFHLGYAWAKPDLYIFKEVNDFGDATLNAAMSNGNKLSCNGVFIRKDIILSHLFNEDRELSASEDYELWLRLSARYPLYYSNEVTSLIIDHEFRSVRNTDVEKIKRRINLLLNYLQADQQIVQFYGKRFIKIKSDLISYISLHIASDAKNKRESFQYLLKTLYINPGFVFDRRFYAILKELLLKW